MHLSDKHSYKRTESFTGTGLKRSAKKPPDTTVIFADTMPLERLNSPEVLNEEVELLLAELAALQTSRKAELSASKESARREAIAEMRKLLAEHNFDGNSFLLALDELQSKAVH
jgi:hypothetical protein